MFQNVISVLFECMNNPPKNTIFGFANTSDNILEQAIVNKHPNDWFCT